MAFNPDHLRDDLAQFYLVVDLVLELKTGYRHKPPRISMEFLAEGGDEPRRGDKTWPTLVIDLKHNIHGDPWTFMRDLDTKVAEHVMPNRRPNRLAFLVQEPGPREGERRTKSYWSVAKMTVGTFPVKEAYQYTQRHY
ncbi:hypothetical protein DL767_000966 [Monosporascus sp. MG133]|nr:hypothetical protein DL767_000966 [Monosporascus sp. MG133]